MKFAVAVGGKMSFDSFVRAFKAFSGRPEIRCYRAPFISQMWGSGSLPEKENIRHNIFLSRGKKKKARTGMTDDRLPRQNWKSKSKEKGEEGTELAMGWMHN